MVAGRYAIAKGNDAAGSQLVGLERLSQALLALVPFGFLAGLLRQPPDGGNPDHDLLRRRQRR